MTESKAQAARHILGNFGNIPNAMVIYTVNNFDLYVSNAYR